MAIAQSPTLEQFMAIVMEQLRGLTTRLDGLDRDIRNTTQYTIEIAVLKQRVAAIEEELKELHEKNEKTNQRMSSHFVQQADFEPIKKLAYAMITAALVSVGSLIWSLVKIAPLLSR